MSRWSISGALLLLLLGLSRPGAAQPACQLTQGGPVPRTAAEFNEVVALASACYKAGQYEPAIAAWDRAYQFQPVPSILYNMGRAHQKAGHDLDALMFYQRFLQAAPEAAAHKEVDGYMAELRGRVQQDLEAARNPPEPPPAPMVISMPVPAASPPPRPFYQKWWFWTTVGGVVAAGVVAGVVVGTRSSSPDLSGYPNLKMIHF
jgi:tetratricopeptide (TPR) repeat protein